MQWISGWAKKLLFLLSRKKGEKYIYTHINKGRRQQFLLSTLLFEIALDVLANKKWKDKQIIGIKIQGEECKMVCCADNVVLIIMQPWSSMQQLMKVILSTILSAFLDTKINKNKTKDNKAFNSWRRICCGKKGLFMEQQKIQLNI